MKKSIRNIMISAVMAAGIFAASATAMAASQYVETTMNFRSAASAASTIIGSIPAGSKVEVLGLDNGWDKVIFNGTTGYIHSGNLTDNYTPAASQTSTAQASDASWGTVFVNDGYLALRSTAVHSDANEIGQLYSGEKVQLQNRFSGDYALVYSPKYGFSGWVHAGYLIFNNAAQTAQAPAPISQTAQNDGYCGVGTWKSVSVNGYLALRSAAAYDAANEIGKLYTGAKVLVLEDVCGNYVQVYSPEYGLYGWVDAGFLA